MKGWDERLEDWEAEKEAGRMEGRVGGWEAGWEFRQSDSQLKFCSQSSYFTFSTGASCSELEILLAAAMEIQWMSLGEMHRIGLKTENSASSL